MSLLKHALTLAPLAALSLTACKGDLTPPEGDEARLQRFSSCGPLRAYMEEVVLETLIQSRYGRGYYWFGAEAAADDADTKGDDAGPTDYTGTNNQEAGVDELDFVKTDGKHIYVVQDNKLYIVKSWPVEDSALVSELAIDGWPYGLFLDGDRLAVFSYAYSDGTDTFFRNWGGTKITFVDIADRAKPKITKTTEIEGWLADGRMIDGRAYMALNSYMPLPQDVWALTNDPALPNWDWDTTDEDLAVLSEQARDILRPKVAALMADIALEDLLPMVREQVAGAAAGAPTMLNECSSIYRPGEVSQHSVLSIVQLDLDGGNIASTGVLSDGWEVYASKDNLYVAQTSWWSWWGWGSFDLDTRIHKFELGGTEPKYVASGEIPGWTLSQFSFSEFEGALRVATTDINWWGWGSDPVDDPANNVFVLEDDGAGNLATVGEIRGIAPGEQIRGVRFMGKKGYVVTFEQIDPLFTIDLSDNTAPKVVGELKIPGFSAYMHPMGPDHLLAVGMDGTDEGQITGLAVNVFDVSDFANPKLAHQWTIQTGDWSGSEAIWDHHAFTYHRDVLSIPAYIYDWGDSGSDWGYFSGLLVLDATKDGVSEIGRVDHSDMVKDSTCKYEELYGYEPGTCDSWYWYAWMRRSLYIEDNVFSISDYGIKVNKLNEPEVELAEVLFYPR